MSSQTGLFPKLIVNMMKIRKKIKHKRNKMRFNSRIIRLMVIKKMKSHN